MKDHTVEIKYKIWEYNITILVFVLHNINNYNDIS